MTTTFIGVDLAWQSDRNNTGIAIARGSSAGATIETLASGLVSLDSIVETINRHATPNTVVAIDAPLIIRNATGRRHCESEISRRFGAKRAGAHSSNLTLYPDPSTHRLVDQLRALGFEHKPSMAARHGGKWLFEVYPHPAHVVLFALPSIFKYKAKRRRSRAVRLSEFQRLQEGLRALATAEPSLRPGSAVTPCWEWTSEPFVVVH